MTDRWKEGLPSSSLPEKATLPTPERSRELEAKDISASVERELLGTSTELGLLARIDAIGAPNEREPIAEQLGFLVSRCGLLFLAGHSEAAFTGTQGFRTAYTRLKNRQETLLKTGLNIGSVIFSTEQACATVLEFIAQLSSVHADAQSILSHAVNPFSAADYKQLQEPSTEKNFRFRGHFALKTRLRKYLVEQELTHLHDDTLEFAIEPNNAIAAGYSVYEETLFPTLDWDDATRERLTAEYQALTGTYDPDEFQRTGGLLERVFALRTSANAGLEGVTHGTDYREFLEALTAFDQRWLNLELAFMRLPRKQT